MQRWMAIKEALEPDRLQRAGKIVKEVGHIREVGKRVGVPWIYQETIVSGHDHPRPADLRVRRIFGVPLVSVKMQGEERFHEVNDWASLNTGQEIATQKLNLQNQRR